LAIFAACFEPVPAATAVHRQQRKQACGRQSRSASDQQDFR